MSAPWLPKKNMQELLSSSTRLEPFPCVHLPWVDRRVWWGKKLNRVVRVDGAISNHVAGRCLSPNSGLTTENGLQRTSWSSRPSLSRETWVSPVPSIHRAELFVIPRRCALRDTYDFQPSIIFCRIKPFGKLRAPPVYWGAICFIPRILMYDGYSEKQKPG
jgi:hypothetical protein